MSLHAVRVSLIRSKNEAMKKLHLKAPLSASKKKGFNMHVITISHTHFSPLDCCLRISCLPALVIFSGDIQSVESQIETAITIQRLLYSWLFNESI